MALIYSVIAFIFSFFAKSAQVEQVGPSKKGKIFICAIDSVPSVFLE